MLRESRISVRRCGSWPFQPLFAANLALSSLGLFALLASTWPDVRHYA
jgi:hypothetical protein